MVATVAEGNLDRFGDRWGFSPALAVRWLAYLRDASHVLSDAEAALLAELGSHIGEAGDGEEEAARGPEE